MYALVFGITLSSLVIFYKRRCYVSVVLLNNIIYAMGGFDGHNRLGSAEKYNFERNQWTMIAPMTTQRSDACAAVMNGKYNVLRFKNLTKLYMISDSVSYIIYNV